MSRYERAAANVIAPATENTDSITRSFKCISFPHHEIHEGNGFNYTEVRDQTQDHVYDIQITTPNTTKWAHMLIEFDTEAETDWYLYENVNIILAGTVVTPLNHNRNSTTTSVLTMAVITNTTTGNANADTAVAGATTLAHGISGSGKKLQGSGASREEWVLKQNEDYCLRFIATAAGYVNFRIDWYEHTNT